MFSRSSDKVTVTEIIALHNAGFIGRIEARNWLANQFPEFRYGRRDDVDKAIEEMGNNALTDIPPFPYGLDEDEDEL